MLVECKCLRNPKLFHYNFAGAISEAPLLVVVSAEYMLSGTDIRFVQVINLCDLTIEQLSTEPQRGPILTARSQQCKRFIYHKVGRQQ